MFLCYTFTNQKLSLRYVILIYRISASPEINRNVYSPRNGTGIILWTIPIQIQNSHSIFKSMQNS